MTKPKLACPHCGCTQSRVVKVARVHPNNRVMRRRRKCDDCGERFWTRESVEKKKQGHI